MFSGVTFSSLADSCTAFLVLILGIKYITVFLLALEALHVCQAGGPVDTLAGRAAIQRDTDRLEAWANSSLMKIGKGRCKALHLEEPCAVVRAGDQQALGEGDHRLPQSAGSAPGLCCFRIAP